MTFEQIKSDYPKAYEKLLTFATKVNDQLFKSLDNIPEKPKGFDKNILAEGSAKILWEKKDRCLYDLFDNHNIFIETGRHTNIDNDDSFFYSIPYHKILVRDSFMSRSTAEAEGFIEAVKILNNA